MSYNFYMIYGLFLYVSLYSMDSLIKFDKKMIQLEAVHVVQFMEIISTHQPFDVAVPNIKALAVENNHNWADVLSDEDCTGRLIEIARRVSGNRTVDMAYMLGTKAAGEWAKTKFTPGTREYEELESKFFIAAMNYDKKSMEILLGMGVDVNVGSYENRGMSVFGQCHLCDSAISYAMEKADISILDLLMKYNVNLNAQKAVGRETPLMIIISGIHCYEKCREYNMFYNAFICFQKLLDKNLDGKVDLDIQDSKGNTALIYAVKYGLAWIVQQLCFRSATVAIKNFKEQSVLDIIKDMSIEMSHETRSQIIPMLLATQDFQRQCVQV